MMKLLPARTILSAVADVQRHILKAALQAVNFYFAVILPVMSVFEIADVRKILWKPMLMGMYSA
jgi:hypothetical protein